MAQAWLWNSLAGDSSTAVGLDNLCSTARITLPAIPQIQVLSVTAVERQNYTFKPSPFVAEQAEPYTGLDFCNVTVTYTHPGWNDTVHVSTWLPPPGKWNGRFLGNGGAGYIHGGESLAQMTMLPGMHLGFAVSTTDGGHSDDFLESIGETNNWAHSSPGNINWPLLVDFASVASHDMATIGKAVAKSFYDTAPKYSYFMGSSTGGRQGHMLAQRYPNDFDGIVAAMPAINWGTFLLGNLWPAFVMHKLGAYPRPCEIDAISHAAISACDGLDGAEDGIVSRPDLCEFDPQVLVGKKFDCNGASATFTTEAAQVVQAAWTGPRSSTGEFQWHGFGVEANLTTMGGTVATQCDESGTCRPTPFTLSTVWIKYWILKDLSFDLMDIDHAQWDDLFRRNINEYASVIETSDPDLSAFNKAGGKLINWHGTGDQAVPFAGSVDYYERVMKRDPKANDYYRLFLAPGASHSMAAGLCPQRQEVLHALMNWVEKGVAPETLRATGHNREGTKLERDICLFPRVQHYVGDDITKPSSFVCKEQSE
ncbi:hypothetical protein NM208_g13082 [Fusarium decemcellulare]|uniref:Uncharacterized protein n=1 Tax=Fusarium decemcellulare TaxID=57161 RepID=A0ACC1RPQ2_9HYPO|nr:hypothetical protein NM208_g13082 [Fusarium decemcellulare]